MCDLQLPEKSSLGAAAYDLRLPEDLFLDPMERWKSVPLGFHTEFPAGFEAFIVERSSIATEKNVQVFHGTIDSDFRGEWKLRVTNMNPCKIFFPKHSKIAQVKFYPVLKHCYHVCSNTSELEPSERANGGFGSTGLI